MINIKKFNIIELDPDLQFSIFLFVKVVIVTLSYTSVFNLYHDMAEMYCWGQEFQLGYHKHPPLVAWISGIWFYIFPKNKFFYFLLANTNAAVGSIFSYLLAKEFLSKDKALISALILALVPLPVSRAVIMYNNDTILLSMWPMCTFFMFKAFRYDKKIYWALAGITSGLSVLSKYYSILLLFTMFLIFMFNHRKNIIKNIFKSCPIICMILFFIVILPNFYWLLKNDFMPINYMVTKSLYYDCSDGSCISKKFIGFLRFIIGSMLMIFPITLIGKFLFKIKYKEMFIPEFSTQNQVFLSFINYTPFIITALFGFIYRLCPRFSVPLWFLSSTFVISKSHKINKDSIKTTSIIVYSSLVICSLIICVINLNIRTFKDAELKFLPYEKISTFITKEWQIAYKAKLKYIAGNEHLPYHIPFYSTNHPSALINFNYKISPWVTEDKIKKNGIAIVCYHYRNNNLNLNDNCIQSAEDTFKWEHLDWQKVNIDEYYFSYAFIRPHYDKTQ